MQRIHLLGSKDVSALSGNTAHAVLPEFMDDRLYTLFFRAKGEKREDVFYINNDNKFIKNLTKGYIHAAGVNNVLLLGTSKTIEKEIKMACDLGIKVTVLLNKEHIEETFTYYSSCLSSGISLAIPCINSEKNNGWGRFSFIHKMVYDKKWDFNRKYYFYELENPAELAMYSKAFIFRVKSTIAGFISKRCYLDSMIGIHYSPVMGSFYKPVEMDIEKHHSYRYDQQFSTFMLNDELIKDFASGKLGSGLWSEYKVFSGGKLNEYN